MPTARTLLHGYRECPQCESTFPETREYFYSRPSRPTQYEYCLAATANGCHERYWAAVRERRRASVIEVVARSRDADRSFGVELESSLGYNPRVRALLTAAGLSVWQNGTYNVRSQWHYKTEHCGSELVSPVLQVGDGFEQIVTACRVLSDAGGRATAACGLHVHVGVSDLTLDELKRVFSQWAEHEPEIRRLVSPSRRTRSWCRAVPRSHVDAVNGLAQARGTGAFSSVVSHAVRSWSKYYSCNIGSYPSKGTLEFRLHQGSLDARKIRSWVEFLLAFVESARQGPIEATTIEDLIDKLDLTSTRKEYLRRRAVALA